MKYLIIVLTFYSTNVYAKNYTFEYNTPDELKITITNAYDKQDAFRQASKLCFKILTKDKYPGEEEGLKIIDICANPKKGL